MARKLIIDTDPGIDDAMAVFLALGAPELELIGLTAIFGNVPVELATTNALRLLEIGGRGDIPVATGADRPLVSDYHGPVPYIHGEDGQGNLFLPPPTTRAVPLTAAEFIVQQVRRYPGEVTLVAIGPLTNLALALELDPEIATLTQEVVIMGGNAFVPGNASPTAEANIRNDPEAADIVFGADWPVTMVGLDVTHKVQMTRLQISACAELASPLGRHVAAIAPLYCDFYAKTYSLDGIYVHDSSAIAYVINPTIFTVERWPVRVDTSSGISRGKTWPAAGNWVPPEWQGRRPVTICTDVDGEGVVNLHYREFNAS
jgi:inosine-uridine nucleoside N-ribohydrolase